MGRSRTVQANVAARRRKVASLWLRGVAPAQIADVMSLPIGTLRRDLEAIREELAEANRANLEQNRDRSIAVLAVVQEQAWHLFNQITSPVSTNKIGALNTVLAAEQLIARLQGTLSPELQQQTTVNILAGSGEWQTVRAGLLAALMPYPEARIAAAEKLAELEAPAHAEGGEGHDGNGSRHIIEAR